MHELSIARALVETVTSAVRPAGGSSSDGEPGAGDLSRVQEVHPRVGALSGVVPEALTFCYDIVTEGTPLAGSALIVASVPASGHCATCRAEVSCDGTVLLTCPACAQPVTKLTGGRELEVSHLVLDDAPEPDAPEPVTRALAGYPA